MKIDGSVSKSGSPIYFIPQLLKPIKDKHILSPFQMKIKALLKKMLGKKKKGKNKKTKKKGGGKSKYNIKMTRKFRRTRRKRGSGPGGNTTLDEQLNSLLKELSDLQASDDGDATKSQKIKKLNEEIEEVKKRLAKEDAEKKAAKKAKNEAERARDTGSADGSSGGRRKRSRRKRRRRTKKRKSRRRKKRSRRRRSRRRKRGGEKGCKRWCGKQKLGDVCNRQSVGSDCQKGLVCAGWNGTLHTCIEGD